MEGGDGGSGTENEVKVDTLDLRVPCELSATPGISLYRNTTCLVSKTYTQTAATWSRFVRTAATHSALRVVDVRLHVHPSDVGMVRKVVCQTTIMRLRVVSDHATQDPSAALRQRRLTRRLTHRKEAERQCVRRQVVEHRSCNGHAVVCRCSPSQLCGSSAPSRADSLDRGGVLLETASEPPRETGGTKQLTIEDHK